jgi:NAD(P)-dependent dehydrogenase (short-subunit alcohol dehydrogenase family)
MSENETKGPLTGKIAVITGAGSGVGQAAAIGLAQEGASVVLVGRTLSALETTAGQLPSGSRYTIFEGDVSSDASMAGLARQVEEEYGKVDLVVNSAGFNVPKRALNVLSYEDYRKVVGINLDGSFLVASHLLPLMRRNRSGTLIFIASDAGLYANVVAGAAYVASKFGVQGLVQSINLEEQANGIRACGIFPGGINTPLLDRRPAPPPPEVRQKLLQTADVVECILLVAKLPPRAVVESLLIRPASA